MFNPIDPNHFSGLLLKYDPVNGFSEEKKTKTNIRIIDFIIKVFRYIFNANTHLQHVVTGLAAKTDRLLANVHQIPMNELENFIVYTRLFQEKVVSKGKVNPKVLDQKLASLTSAFYNNSPS